MPRELNPPISVPTRRASALHTLGSGKSCHGWNKSPAGLFFFPLHSNDSCRFIQAHTSPATCVAWFNYQDAHRAFTVYSLYQHCTDTVSCQTKSAAGKQIHRPT